VAETGHDLPVAADQTMETYPDFGDVGSVQIGNSPA
jgi:hypothetical protein